MRKPRTAPAGTVVAYLRVSTAEQACSGLGIEAQRAAVAAYAERKGLTIVAEFIDDGISAKSLTGRPGALAALDAVRSGQAAGLLVSKMDRLSRSVVDGASLMDESRTSGWSLHFADLDVDSSTPSGEMALSTMIVASQYERRLISSRTRDALAAKRARGERLGRPTSLPAEVVQRIVDAKAGGLSLRAIAGQLNADDVATGHGGASWHASTVKAVLDGQAAAELAA